jgi:hypothetical protein
MSGDLRLSDVWSEGFHRDLLTGDRVETQYILKHYTSRNVHIYRRMMVYLRMAEALNMAGYPHMAFQILSQGLSNKVINEEVIPYYNLDESDKSDSIFLARFDFPDTRYAVATPEDIVSVGSQTHNQIGIHTRGSGWTPMNIYYQMPNDTIEPDAAKRAQLVQEQQAFVDSLILNESALEFMFEGTRYYDIMRYAMHQSNPGAAMSKCILGRRGKENAGIVSGEIQKDLTNPNNWYLQWKGKIGM